MRTCDICIKFLIFLTLSDYDAFPTARVGHQTGGPLWGGHSTGVLSGPVRASPGPGRSGRSTERMFQDSAWRLGHRSGIIKKKS